MADDANAEFVDIESTLRRVFRKDSFRALQREVISAIIDDDDVFVQASTSFGKSLCFQLPAVATHGVTIVVCPLLSLMVDQVAALKALGVAVTTINSTVPYPERRVIWEELLSGQPRTKILYVTPELCLSDSFRRNIQTLYSQGQLNRIAIDEAHCISEWGHDFRPAYRELSWFRRSFLNPIIPITALTATATPRVLADVIRLLELDTNALKEFKTPSARPNIHYEVRYLEDFASDPTCPEAFQINNFLAWLKSIQKRREARVGPVAAAEMPPMTGIVYVAYRSVCEQLAAALSGSGNNINAVAYHAGLPAEERSKIQLMWSSSNQSPETEETEDQQKAAFTIIVATNAFGMGIDNPHVRFVVHWTPPRSFEGFVQESGRAGRDGRASVSLVYYNTQERDRIREYLRRDAEKDQNRAGVKRSYSGSTLGGNNNNNNTNANNLSKLQNQQARNESFQKVTWYCESTSRCRHDVIKDYSGDYEIEPSTRPTTDTSNRAITTRSRAARATSSRNPDNRTQAPKSEKDKDAEDVKPPRLESSPRSSPCDFACDFCKEGGASLVQRKAKMCPPSPPEDLMDFGFASIMQAMFPGAFRGSRPGGYMHCHGCM